MPNFAFALSIVPSSTDFTLKPFVSRSWIDNLLYMKQNITELNVTVIMMAHFMSPLIKAGKGPKKKVVHENPTGAILLMPVSGFSRFSFICIVISCLLL